MRPSSWSSPRASPDTKLPVSSKGPNTATLQEQWDYARGSWRKRTGNQQYREGRLCGLGDSATIAYCIDISVEMRSIVFPHAQLRCDPVSDAVSSPLRSVLIASDGYYWCGPVSVAKESFPRRDHSCMSSNRLHQGIGEMSILSTCAYHESISVGRRSSTSSVLEAHA